MSILNGLGSVFLGILFLLFAYGAVRMSANWETNEAHRKKYEVLLKLGGPAMSLFGLLQIWMGLR